MSSYTEGQTHQLMNQLEEAGFTKKHLTQLGQDSERLLQLKQVLDGNAEIQIIKRVLELAKTFDIAEFFGNEDCTIWKGPIDGDGLEGEEDRDIREDSLTTIDPTYFLRGIFLKGSDSAISGRENLRRLKKSGEIRLAGKSFLTLWKDYQENKASSMLEYLYKVHNITYIDFMGLVLRNSIGDQYVLRLCRDGDGTWFWFCCWLDDDEDDDPAVAEQKLATGPKTGSNKAVEA